MKQAHEYQQTEEAIKNAMIQLINQEGLAKVNIRRITELAHINRSTFYRHYIDLPDLIDSYKNKVLEQINKIINEELTNTMIYYLTEEVISPYSLYKKITNLIYSDWAFYQAWLGTNGHLDTILELKKLVKNAMLKRIKQLEKKYTIKPDIPIEFAEELVIDQLWTIIEIWLKQDVPMTAKEINNIFLKTRYDSPYDLLGLPRKKAHN